MSPSVGIKEGYQLCQINSHLSKNSRISLSFLSSSFFSLIFLGIINSFVILSADSITPKGVSLSRASLYDPQKDFSCLDGSKLIPFSFVNDDYCDCKDGSDEPGTSACSQGSFYCQNIGYMSMNIPSSRVNDQLCDCCDGTDEAPNICPNTCDELGYAARVEAERQAQLAKEGYQKRLEMIQRGKDFKKAKEEEKLALEAEKITAESVKQNKEKIKETVEEPEKAALEVYKEKEEAKKKEDEEAEKEKSDREAEDIFNLLDTNQDGKITPDEVKVRAIFDRNKDGEVSDEEASFFLNMETEMSKDEFLATGWILFKPVFIAEAGLFIPPGAEEDSAPSDTETEKPTPPPQENEDDEQEEQIGSQEEEEEEHTPEEEPDEEEEAYEQDKQEPQTEAPSKYDPDTQALIDEANNARTEFNEADRVLREVSNKLDDVSRILEIDFGDDDRFASLHGQCIDFEDREYIYTICLFDQATQKGKGGGGEISLGKWNSWNGPESNKYLEMLYDRGQSCWNGPNRSVKVIVNCGLETKIIAVNEPSRCVYQMDLDSPLACSKPLDGSSLGHDEL